MSRKQLTAANLLAQHIARTSREPRFSPDSDSSLAANVVSIVVAACGIAVAIAAASTSF